MLLHILSPHWEQLKKDCGQMLMNGVLCVGTLSFNSKKEKLSELTEKKFF